MKRKNQLGQALLAYQKCLSRMAHQRCLSQLVGVCMNYGDEWFRNEFCYHEENMIHDPAELEMNFYDAIASGDLEAVRENNARRVFMQMDGRGVLSVNPLRNFKYHLIITAAMVARYCVQKGMPKERAYTISDFYINAVDVAESVEEVLAIHDAMCLDYCRQMKESVVLGVCSRPVALALDFIYKHLHDSLTTDQIAVFAGVSRSYLSKVFAREMGVPISKYIMRVKMEKAGNMLRYSDFSVSAIANNLGFSSESYFIQVFKQFFGVTPLKYREVNFRSDWKMEKKTD